jgi:hypothetical protein
MRGIGRRLMEKLRGFNLVYLATAQRNDLTFQE